ncbi:MAG: TolC family protein [Myxococcota bacterium]
MQRTRATALVAAALLALLTTPAGAQDLLDEAPETDAPEGEAPEGEPPETEATEEDSEAAEEDVERIGWDALVEEVERTSPLMDAARAGLDRFKAKLRQARAAKFPTFKLEGGAAPAPTIRDRPDDGGFLGVEVDFTEWGYLYRMQLQMVQPLFTFGKLRGLDRAAHHGIDVGEAKKEAARWELRYRTAQAWYGAILARELEEILSEGKDWLEKAQDRMERLRAQDSPDYDQMEHLRLKARVAEFYELDAQNNQVATKARQGLRLLLSRPRGHRIEPKPDSLEPVELELLPVERYVEAAIGGAPKLDAARAGQEAREDLADVKAAALWPDFVLVADARLSDSNVVDESIEIGTETLGASAGFLFALRWTLDFGRKAGERDEARAQAREAAHEAEVARDMLELEIRDLHQQILDKRKLVDVYEDSRKAAKGWLHATWDLYDTGFGSFKEVMDALVQFYSKKLGYLQVVHDYNLLVVELSRTIGADATRMEPRPGEQSPGPD